MWAPAAGACASAGPAAGVVAAALQFFAASQCLLQEPYPRQADVINGSSFDFIIVGGGTAGSTLAARLAQLHFDVLLLEAGGDPPEESIIPGFSRTMQDSLYDWNFTSVDDGYSSQAMEQHRDKQPRGKMLGGTGSLNDMVYSRGHPTDYHEWAALAGDAWNWTNVVPFFIKTEHMTDERIVNNSTLMQYHGTHGDIEVSGLGTYTFPTAKMLEAFHELGIDTVDDMTYPHKIGAGRFSHTVCDGRRDSSLTALLNKVHGPDLHVLKDTYVTKILIEDNKAIGVKALSDDEDIYFYTKNEVIISAGTFNTPKLLMLSGIGPKDFLEALNIEVHQDLPVGDNLHDHVMVLYFLAMERGTCTPNEATEYFDMIKYLYDASGPLSYSDSMGVYLPEQGGDPNVPYMAIYPTCVPQSQFTYDVCLSLGYTYSTCSVVVEENEKYELISLAVVLLKPLSRGKVRLASTDPLEDPLIYTGTFSNEADLDGYPAAVKLALSLVNTTYFREKKARIIQLVAEGCEGLDETEWIKCNTRGFTKAAWHAVGTAALGTVLDEQLRVRGVQALRVVDASVMPTVIRGNTNAPVVMIAEQAAHFIGKAYGVK